jgi:hypothetical protein
MNTVSILRSSNGKGKGQYKIRIPKREYLCSRRSQDALISAKNDGLSCGIDAFGSFCSCFLLHTKLPLAAYYPSRLAGFHRASSKARPVLFSFGLISYGYFYFILVLFVSS